MILYYYITNQVNKKIDKRFIEQKKIAFDNYQKL